MKLDHSITARNDDDSFFRPKYFFQQIEDMCMETTTNTIAFLSSE